MSEREKSNQEEKAERQEASEINENDLEEMGSTYRMLKIEIDMVNS